MALVTEPESVEAIPGHLGFTNEPRGVSAARDPSLDEPPAFDYTGPWIRLGVVCIGLWTLHYT